MTLSAKIKAARALKRMTQKQLAESAGVSLVYIKQLEKGKEPKIALVKIAKALGVSLDELLG